MSISHQIPDAGLASSQMQASPCFPCSAQPVLPAHQAQGSPSPTPGAACRASWRDPALTGQGPPEKAFPSPNIAFVNSL